MSPQTWILGGLVALAAAAPLPFGSVPQWAGAGLAGCIGGLLAAWGAMAVRGSVPLIHPPRRFWWTVAPFLAALGWAFTQTLTGLPEWLRNPLWPADAVLGRAGAASIALDPLVSRAAAVGVAACAGAFWLALQTGRDASRAAWAFLVLGLAAGAQALYAVLVHVAGADYILWFPKTAYHDVATGTFVNRNTFAAHAGLGLLCIGAALRDSVEADLAHHLPRRERLRRLLAEHPVRKGLLLGAAALLGLAILLSESRAGAMATLLGLAAFVSILALRGARPLRAAVAAACALGLGLSVTSCGEGLERRLASAERDWAERRQVAAETLNAIRTSPLRGVGLGGFEAAHRAHREAAGTLRIQRAHNEYLETALELGVPGALAFFASLGGLALACAWGAVHRRRAAYPAAGLAACVLVGAHSLVDFSMRAPAVSLLFSLMLGIAVAHTWRRGGT